MASAELRIINRRIKSVKSTKKITRAMELIASSRIVKAQQRLTSSNNYTNLLAQIVDMVNTKVRKSFIRTKRSKMEMI